MQLGKWAKTLRGLESHCVSAYAEAFEIIPYTLAENAGLHPIQIVTELRNKHATGEKTFGINVRKVSFVLCKCYDDIRVLLRIYWKRM